ncbi:hypothetical protein VQH23_22600 [Pararoseomonas sp. SCSIO 73927]|uniref:hypothetical protein n=1 Tax=Pararoseomonas sp. SCSIO 73927 TaxID=3114537 RepID=UPI0030D5CBF6
MTRTRRSAALLAAAILAAPAARAAATESNEPLVMRIIFEECLGYVRAGRTPFQGLPTAPASAEAIARLPSRMPDRERAVQLLSPRYVASWGEDANGRHCYVGSEFAAVQAGLPGRLGVPVKGFLDRVTARAAKEGLRDAALGEEFSPLSISSWSEPETGHDRGPMRPVSFSLLATTPADAGGIADAGLIMMGGPTGGRR